MSEHKESKIPTKNEKWMFFGIITTVAISIEILSGVLLYYCFNKNWDEANKFGDSFGVTNTLFSGVALAGVIYTLILQKNAIEEQKNQFIKADEDSKLTQANREKTFAIFQQQVNELSRAAEIQAIQLSISLLDDDITSLGIKETYKKRLNILLTEMNHK